MGPGAPKCWGWHSRWCPSPEGDVRATSGLTEDLLMITESEKVPESTG